MKSWLSQLAKLEIEATYTANDLYCGDGWSSIRSAVMHVQKRDSVKLWIASAGYGLINSTDLVVPYSATFSTGQEDSVSQGQDPAGNQKWWEGLAKHKSKSSYSVASIADVARVFPNTPLLVGVSPPYLNALLPDLLAAAKVLSDPELLIIVSAGTKKAVGLTDHLLPCDARLEHRLGGARASLNARIVAYIIKKFDADDLRMPILKKHFENILKRAPEHRTYDRKKISEKQVETFIRKSLRKHPSASFSVLLRMLRDSGVACEYKRFRELFRAITSPTTSQA